MAFTASNGRTQTSLADINITPLVDVVLVLLIIFMLTARVLQSGIEVSVPKTRTVKEITEERMVISINKQQRVFLGNDPVNINEIGARLRQKIRDPQHHSIFVLADETKGVSQSKPKPEVTEPEAIPIPEKNAKKKPKHETSASKRNPEPEPVEEANNVVPFGQGGPVSGPYGTFSAGGAKGGFGFTGGGGDFGTRFGWYVDTVRRKVSDNWLKYEIDPRIGEARRVYLVFDITRDGHPSHIEVEQSSGVPSLDQSAVRALQRIDTFGPLPSDYSGNKVSVEFWFDYKR